MPFTDMLKAYFQSKAVRQARERSQGSSAPSDSGSSPSPTSGSEQTYYGPAPYTPQAALDQLTPEEREAFLTGKPYPSGSVSRSTRSYPSYGSGGGGTVTWRSDWTEIPKAILLTPVALVVFAALLLSPIYMGITCYRLWPAWVRMTETADFWIGIGILFGPIIVGGFLIGALVGRFLSRSDGFRGNLLAFIAYSIPVLLCLPIIVNAWWHSMPTFISQVTFPDDLLRVLPSQATTLLFADFRKVYSLLIVGGGWFFFLGTFIPYLS